MSNGKVSKAEIQEETLLPAVMQSNDVTQRVVSDLKDAISRPRNNADLSRYQVMEGMQNEEKIPFFTEFINDDDVLRMNTIEAYAMIVPKIVRKTSEKNRLRIQQLMNDVYIEHVKTHKRNMTSKSRGRESAYTKILANESQEQIVPSGLTKFFGVGGKKK